MKMVSRTPTVPSLNRSLAVLIVLLILGVAGIAAARDLGASFGPVAPRYLPAKNPAPLAPTVEATFAPIPVSDPVTSPFPATQTAEPPPAAPAPAAPVATTLPRPTVPVGPATTAAPRDDVHVIAPEPGMPSFSPPPGRE
jgi:hypothetical protein